MQSVTRYPLHAGWWWSLLALAPGSACGAQALPGVEGRSVGHPLQCSAVQCSAVQCRVVVECRTC